MIFAIFRAFLSLLLALGIMTVGPYDGSQIQPGDVFTPVLRFCVASDVHTKSTDDSDEYRRLQKLFDSAYAYAETQEYNAVDAFVFVGDSVNDGTLDQWQRFMRVVNSKIREDSEFIISYANSHDCGGDGSLARCEEVTGVKPNNVWNINGFNFITVSQSEQRTFIYASGWLNRQLSAAKKADPEKPIFVFQHYHVSGTVYGSLGWGTPELSPVLNCYPQIIDFSGHSHFPVNDPRSIHQGFFTSVGTGTLSYFELENGMSYGSVPPNARQAAQYHIVEVDAANRVRIMPYNILTDAFFKDPASKTGEQLIYYVDSPSDKKSYVYTDARYATADAPVFPENAEMKFSEITSDSAVITFTQATDGECMNNYDVVLRDEKGKKVNSFKFWSDFYIEPTPETMSYKMEGLEPGKTYSVTVTAWDTYAISSKKPLTGSFTTAQ